MLTKEEQIAAYIKVGEMCKGTKFEGKEYLCVKLKQPGFDTEYRQYTDDSIDFDVKWDRIFAVAIVDDTPIWLEEPFTLYQASNNIEFTYKAECKALLGKSAMLNKLGSGISGVKVSIPIKNVVWESFTLTKPMTKAYTNFFVQADNASKIADSTLVHETKLEELRDIPVDAKQIGGTHYKSKAIQPWAYMEANYTKEEFVGFLRGNVHKYLDRYKDRNGIEDLKKAIHYIEKLIEVESR